MHNTLVKTFLVFYTVAALTAAISLLIAALQIHALFAVGFLVALSAIVHYNGPTLPQGT